MRFFFEKFFLISEQKYLLVGLMGICVDGVWIWNFRWMHSLLVLEGRDLGGINEFDRGSG